MIFSFSINFFLKFSSENILLTPKASSLPKNSQHISPSWVNCINQSAQKQVFNYENIRPQGLFTAIIKRNVCEHKFNKARSRAETRSEDMKKTKKKRRTEIFRVWCLTHKERIWVELSMQTDVYCTIGHNYDIWSPFEVCFRGASKVKLVYLLNRSWCETSDAFWNSYVQNSIEKEKVNLLLPVRSTIETELFRLVFQLIE